MNVLKLSLYIVPNVMLDDVSGLLEYQEVNTEFSHFKWDCAWERSAIKVLLCYDFYPIFKKTIESPISLEV